MKTRKINLDRAPISSEKIESQQNFDHVLKNYNALKPTFWKSPWFYGPIGLASIALVVAISVNNPKKNADDNKNTLAKTELPEDTKCIHAPFEDKDVPFQTFEINTSKDEKIVLPSGSMVEIPKGSIKAEKTTEKIELKIREFDSKAEAFLAGVPMDYKEKAFVSAGMIEIRAVQNNKELIISEGKTLKVDLKLNQDPNGFDFWRLDEEEKKWGEIPVNYLAENKSNEIQKTNIKTESKEEILAKIDAKIIEVIEKSNSLIEPLRKDFLLPEKGSQRFDIEFDSKDYPELEKLKGVEFEVDTKNKYDKSFTKKTWENVDLSKKGLGYLVTFSNSKEKFQIPVRPVLIGDQKEKAEEKFESVFEVYKTKKHELDFEKEQLQKNKIEVSEQKEVNTIISNINRTIQNAGNYRATFSVTVFGVFNCDKPISYPKATTDEFAFTYSNNESLEPVSVFLFDKNKNVRYSYGNYFIHPISELGFHKNNENVLVVIDKSGNLGYLNNASESKLNGGKIKVQKIDEKDVNLQMIQKLINESSIDA